MTAPVMTEKELALLPAADRKKAEREARKAERDAAAARKAEEDAKNAHLAEPSQPEPPEEPVVSPPEPPEEPPVRSEDADTVEKQEYETLKAEYEALKHKHKTLQGKFNAEVPRLKHEMKEREAQFASRLESLERKLTAPQAPQSLAPSVPAHLKYLSEQEREDAGESESLVIKQVRGLLDESMGGVRSDLEALRKEYEQLKQSAQAEKQGSREAVIWGAVEKQLPGAKGIFDNYLVKDWLENTPDPDSVTGASYFDKADDAFLLGRAKDVAAVLRTAADAIGMELEPGAEVLPPPAQPPVKPGRSAADGAPKSTSQPKNIPVSEIEQFYELLATPRGLRHDDGSKWTADEISAKEKEYDRAMAQGRIVRDK